jgi:hypothetical protein
MPSDRPRTLEEIRRIISDLIDPNGRVPQRALALALDAAVTSALREAEARGRAQGTRDLCRECMWAPDVVRALSVPPGSREPGAGAECGVETVSGTCWMPRGHAGEHDDRPLYPPSAEGTGTRDE